MKKVEIKKIERIDKEFTDFIESIVEIDTTDKTIKYILLNTNKIPTIINNMNEYKDLNNFTHALQKLINY